MGTTASRLEILAKEGWSERFIASEPRLSEAIDMYMEAGFEVHLEPLPKKSTCDDCPGNDDDGECRVCFEGSEDQYKIIFTRVKRGENVVDEDLL